jgi:hypothetical protein
MRARLRERQDTAGPRTRATVHVHIEGLVLAGFRAGSARRIADGLTSELRHLISRAGVPVPMMLAAGAPRIDAGTVRTVTGPAPTLIGRQVVAAVHRGMRA